MLLIGETKAFFEKLQRSILESQDESGNLAARPLLIGSTALVGENLRQASNLAEAMRRCAAAYNMLHGGYYNRVDFATGAIVYRIDVSRFPFRDNEQWNDRFALMEGVLVFLHTLLARWAGRDLDPYLLAVHSMRGPSKMTDGPRPLALLPAPVRSGADLYGLEYRRSAGDFPRAQSCPSLDSTDIYHAIIRQIDERASANTRNGQTGLAPRVLTLLLSGAMNQSQVAARLGVSAATMRRRLTDEGTTFRALRASGLDQRAKRMLDGGRDVATVANALGFSDARSFSRAFKAWNGETPAAYRAGLKSFDSPG